MKLTALRTPEKKFAMLGIVLGFAVSYLLALGAKPFLPNFEFYWGSQLVVIATILLMRPRPAIVGGLSVCLAVILSGFKAWLSIRSNANPDGLVWLIYLMLLAGAAVGAVIAIYWLRGKRAVSWLLAACIIATAATGGCIVGLLLSLT